MEGVSAEASSLAGHLCLDNLILFYDANQVTLDGPLAQSGSEDTVAATEPMVGIPTRSMEQTFRLYIK